MMIHLVDQDTKETFQCYGDNEVKAAIAAARASGKIVNMELDDNRRDCLIYITRPRKDLITELDDESHKVTVLITETAKTITEMLHEITMAASETLEQVATTLKPILEEVGTLGPFMVGRAPSEIKKEIRHTKNPMRLSQLYRELDEAYKRNGRKHK